MGEASAVAPCGRQLLNSGGGGAATVLFQIAQHQFSLDRYKGLYRSTIISYTPEILQ